MIRKLGLEELIASKPSPQRDLVIAMVAERLLFPSSKLAHTRHWHSTTLAEEMGVAHATEDHLYEAMDWLLQRQAAIEKKLAQRHLGEGALVLYDVTSSYYEGKTCPLARYGHDRDGKTGCPIIVYGVLTDAEAGRSPCRCIPATPQTPRPFRIRSRRSQSGSACREWCWLAIAECSHKLRLMCSRNTRDWAGSRRLRSGAIRRLLAKGHLIKKDLEAKRLAEISSPDFPGERLVACYNAQLAEQRRHKRQELLAATQADLEALATSIARQTGPPEKAADIGVRAGKIINHYKVAKHFTLTIT